MTDIIPASELKVRMNRFCQIMDQQHPEWEMAVVFSKINMLYFAGSMADGVLIIERGKDAILWARKSYERTSKESEFEDIRQIGSFRDAAENYATLPKNVYLETEFVPLAAYHRFQKHFPFESYKSLDFQIAQTRSVKSNWEVKHIEEAGAIHRRVLEDIVPTMLREGMTETDLAAELYQVMVKEGHHGTARFGMHDTEIVVAQLGFGDSSLYPTNFDGPGGNRGLNAAVPSLGNRKRKLKKGDLVFVDMGLGVNGYHSDKTMTYMFGESLPQEVIEIHKQCVNIQDKVAEMLKPGNIPEVIYESIMEDLSPEFQKNFMGFGNRQVKFIGHGIGLTVDEMPVLAKGFKDPLVENMVFAVEPKKGIEGIGMVGIENTFLVTPEGGRSLTGTNPGLIFVK
ncbi:M24 family metallopeptidase [Plebeiibacterium sediminum]|uniref:Xaa-Pro peptidase family protein n=1 Tax=Plebeiibacterium sediminum TaxID=2992112 RepID=A0AAE3SDU6_9BACT|nr:Xaa-Pro peptidase family protein [Plebeiobacterium sediminum]MCW3785431.1 Xaa-Pro peptidase family protein [Plebeiobacterium sediminum]